VVVHSVGDYYVQHNIIKIFLDKILANKFAAEYVKDIRFDEPMLMSELGYWYNSFNEVEVQEHDFDDSIAEME
jgi:hypothetical protein